MIMFCMNRVSAGECGGNVARVEGGSVRVGWPGAPGWTTTGVCCPAMGVSIAAAKSPLCHRGTLITERTLCLARKYLITNGHSLHSLTEALRSFSSAGQFIPQVSGFLHGDPALFAREVDGIIKLLRKIQAAPLRI